MKKRAWLIAALVVVILTVAAAALLLPRLAAPTALPAASDALTQAANGLDDVTISAVLNAENGTLTVSQELRLVNRTGAAQSSVLLRTYANAFRSEDYSPAATDELHSLCYPNGFSEGALRFTSFKQQTGSDAEQGATYAYDDDAHTALRVTLTRDWAQNEALTLRMDYVLTIPQAAYRFGQSGGVTALGNVFVQPAVYADGGYLADEYGSIGDPFVSECRNWHVSLTLPEGYSAAGSADAIVTQNADGTQTLAFEAPAVRDFALAISKDYVLAQAAEGNTLVKAYALTAEKAKLLLRYGRQALKCFSERYGAYPYQTYTLSEVDFPFGGMEYPSLVMIGSTYLNADGETLEQLIAHETAHQWWYAVVGSDQYRQAWQDEALSEFSVLDYWETYYGKAARGELQFSRVETAMRISIPHGVTPGSPVDYFGSLSEYTTVVYSRGAAALCALDTAMNGALDEFLRTYYDTYAFTLASRDEFEALLKRFSGEDWSPLLSDYLDTYIDN